MRQFALILLFAISSITGIFSQINTDRVLSIGRNALYFEDYILSIQYFNQVIRIKPYLADPYFFRAIAKINLEDYQGAEDDCTLALDRNPFMINAYKCRGIARINLKKYKESIEDFKRIEFDPDNKRFCYTRCRISSRQKIQRGRPVSYHSYRQTFSVCGCLHQQRTCLSGFRRHSSFHVRFREGTPT